MEAGGATGILTSESSGDSLQYVISNHQYVYINKLLYDCMFLEI